MTDALQPEPVRALARAAALDLDDLLGEIRSRAAGAQRSQERLAVLLDAVVAVSSNLDLSTVLKRIVDCACTLVDARYGALGVVDDSGQHLVEFITHGMPAHANVGDPPTGLGILGLLLREPHSRRIADLTAHPGSAGMPPGHPPMHSFVGTPIRVRDQVFGNLYLTEKRGGSPFSEEDERLLVALSAAAAIAIENAQLFRKARRNRDWAHAVGELTQTLLEGRNERSALVRMVKRARELGNAEMALLAMTDDTGTLVVRALETSDAVRGLIDAEEHDQASERIGQALLSPRWRMVVASRVPLLLMADPNDEHVGVMSHEIRSIAGLAPEGSTAVVPITVGDVEVGLIALCWPIDGTLDAADTMEVLTRFGEQMGLAIEASRAQRSRARAVLLEDRDRIARDMHDHVIQRLFATGLSLQSASRRTEGPVQEKIDAAVGELDAAVKDIRRAIFELHHQIPEGGLGPELEALVARAAEGFGFMPDVSFEALSDIPVAYESDVVAVVREGLANIIRHADASDAQVLVSAVNDVVVVVRDNGKGMPPDAARSGLVNLRERALARGGTCEINMLHPSGSEVVWRVPLPD